MSAAKSNRAVRVNKRRWQSASLNTALSVNLLTRESACKLGQRVRCDSKSVIVELGLQRAWISSTLLEFLRSKFFWRDNSPEHLQDWGDKEERTDVRGGN
jgi:hypothetical protein